MIHVAHVIKEILVMICSIRRSLFLACYRYASTGNLVSTASVGIGSPASSAMGGQSFAGIFNLTLSMDGLISKVQHY